MGEDVRRFSISDIESITGIKAHTIRVWEQRYQIVETKRTETNIRYYDDRDLCRFLNISTLIDNGYKISEVALMSSDEITTAVSTLAKDYQNTCLHVNALSNATLNFDERSFHATLKFCIANKGVNKTMVDTIFPFMRKLGIMWQTGVASPAHEHFASDLVKRQLICAIGALKNDSKNYRHKFMLFLPELETHEVGLLFAHYLLAAAGNHVLYLGQNIPYEDLRGAAGSYEPDYCLTSLTSILIDNDINKVINRIFDNLGDRKLLVSGPMVKADNVNYHSNLIPLVDIESFIRFISEANPVQPREGSEVFHYSSKEG